MASSNPLKYTFFLGSGSPFSQFHKCKFTVEGFIYNCAEQYMMHQKAVLFGDNDIADKILKSTSQKQQKSFGRKVSNFNQDTWDENSRKIVYKGNFAKFSQNEDLKQKLLDTKGTTLVEASPDDKIWGIGYAEDHPNAKDETKWQGENRLGYILTDVREAILKEELSCDTKHSTTHSNATADSSDQNDPKMYEGNVDLQSVDSVSHDVSTKDSNVDFVTCDSLSGGQDPQGQSGKYSEGKEQGMKVPNTQSTEECNRVGKYDSINEVDLNREDCPRNSTEVADSVEVIEQLPELGNNAGFQGLEEQSGHGEINVPNDNCSDKLEPGSEFLSCGNCDELDIDQSRLDVKLEDSEKLKASQVISETLDCATEYLKSFPCEQIPTNQNMASALDKTGLDSDKDQGVGPKSDAPDQFNKMEDVTEPDLSGASDHSEKAQMSSDTINESVKGNGEEPILFNRTDQCNDYFDDTGEQREPVLSDATGQWPGKDFRDETVLCDTNKTNCSKDDGIELSSNSLWYEEHKAEAVSQTSGGVAERTNNNPETALSADFDKETNEQRLCEIEDVTKQLEGVKMEEDNSIENQLHKSTMDIGTELQVVKSCEKSEKDHTERRVVPALLSLMDTENIDSSDEFSNPSFSMIPKSGGVIEEMMASSEQGNTVFVEEYEIRSPHGISNKENVSKFLSGKSNRHVLKDLVGDWTNGEVLADYHMDESKKETIAKLDREKSGTVVSNLLSGKSKKQVMGEFEQGSKKETVSQLLRGKNNKGIVSDFISGKSNKEVMGSLMGSKTCGKVTSELEDKFISSTGKSDAACSDHEKYTYFWKSESPFSQWYKCRFSVEGTSYNCAEQFMMQQKAVLFGDKEIAAQIMLTDSQRKQKSLGRKVSNFSETVWNENCQKIVYKGNLAKNEDLREILLNTKGTVLAEASPVDSIWGIGYTEDHPKAKQRQTWRGQNLLGFILTDVREAILRGELLLQDG